MLIKRLPSRSFLLFYTDAVPKHLKQPAYLQEKGTPDLDWSVHETAPWQRTWSPANEKYDKFNSKKTETYIISAYWNKLR